MPFVFVWVSKDANGRLCNKVQSMIRFMKMERIERMKSFEASNGSDGEKFTIHMIEMENVQKECTEPALLPQAYGIDAIMRLVYADSDKNRRYIVYFDCKEFLEMETSYSIEEVLRHIEFRPAGMLFCENVFAGGKGLKKLYDMEKNDRMYINKKVAEDIPGKAAFMGNIVRLLASYYYRNVGLMVFMGVHLDMAKFAKQINDIMKEFNFAIGTKKMPDCDNRQYFYAPLAVHGNQSESGLMRYTNLLLSGGSDLQLKEEVAAFKDGCFASVVGLSGCTSENVGYVGLGSWLNKAEGKEYKRENMPSAHQTGDIDGINASNFRSTVERMNRKALSADNRSRKGKLCVIKQNDGGEERKSRFDFFAETLDTGRNFAIALRLSRSSGAMSGRDKKKGNNGNEFFYQNGNSLLSL